MGSTASFLKQQILEQMQSWTPEAGSPQGAVISPLLSNIYLHEVDKAMKVAGYEMVRYADDCVPRAHSIYNELCATAQKMRLGPSEPVCGAGSKPPQSAVVKSHGGER